MAGILATSSSALLVFQKALATTSNNIANVSTDGYSRQRLELSNRRPTAFGDGFLGNGVQTDTVRRLVDGFNTIRQLDSSAELGRLTIISSLSNRIDTSFTDPATSLAQPWSQLYDAANGVATDPGSTAARQAYLESARTLTARLRYLSSQLQSIDSEVNQRLQSGTIEVTRLSNAIADLNAEIVVAQANAGGQPPNDLLDKRDLLVKQLSSLVGATTVAQDDGSVNVFTVGGQALVVGTTVLAMSTQQDPFRAERQNVVLSNGGSQILLPDSALGGELGGLLEFRATVLDPAIESLGAMAVTLAFNTNFTNAEGVDLYGNSGAAIFNQPTLNSLVGLNNTGSGTLTSTVTDIAAYDARDLTISFDGASYTAAFRRTGVAVPISGSGTVADPLVVNGVSIVVAGAPAAGDTFLVQPAAGAAGRISVAMTDPRGVAAAAPLRVSAALTNFGTAQPSLSIVDRNDVNFNVPTDVVFIDPLTYTTDGGATTNVYTPGTPIVLNGWSLSLLPDPTTGDTFSVNPTGPNSSDNANALVLAQLDDAKLLAGGTGSMNEALRQMIVEIGASARGSESARSAQEVIHGQLVDQRNSLSGVNLDEEASNLLKFQQAYQAAAQMIATADTVFQSLLAAVR